MTIRLAGLAPATITARLEAVTRLQAWLDPVPLLAATGDQLHAYERRLVGLAPASVNIDVRHVQAFYRWAARQGHVAADPSTAMIVPRVPRGRAQQISQALAS